MGTFQTKEHFCDFCYNKETEIKENPYIMLLLNASCMQAECEFGSIHSVTAWQLTTVRSFVVCAEGVKVYETDTTIMRS